MGAFERKFRKQIAVIGGTIVKDKQGNNHIIAQTGKNQNLFDKNGNPILNYSVPTKQLIRIVDLAAGRGISRKVYRRIRNES